MSTINKRLYEIADYLITTGNQADAFFLRKMANPIANPTFMIGQRVIYNDVICTICKPEDRTPHNPDKPWIDNPEKGFKHWVAKENLIPLPNAQL